MSARTNENIWFRTLYDDFFAKVYAFARKHSKDTDEAEDLAHDVFLKFWQNRTTFSETIPVDAQLLTIAKQLIINRYKRETVRQRVYADWQQTTAGATTADDAERLVQTAELDTVLRAVLDELPLKRREIFEKSRFEYLSYDEIADQMGISRATVESQMVKALRTLREKLIHTSGLVLLFFLPF